MSSPLCHIHYRLHSGFLKETVCIVKLQPLNFLFMKVSACFLKKTETNFDECKHRLLGNACKPGGFGQTSTVLNVCLPVIVIDRCWPWRACP